MMKHTKKRKSKMSHCLSKKDRMKSASAEIQMNTEAPKELAMKQEYKRAEKRMALSHTNRNKRARHILEHGMYAQDEGTRAAMAEQVHQHSILTTKINSTKENSSSGDSDDEDYDETAAGSDQDGASKVLAKAKEKTIKVLEEDDELAKSAVLALPFMSCDMIGDRGPKTSYEDTKFESGTWEKADREEILNEENPEPEKSVLQWTKLQTKKGAHFKNVIMCDRVDKKTEKLYAKTLPHPFTSQQVFEQSM